MRILENLFSRADLRGPNHISLIILTEALQKHLQGVLCEKMFLKRVAQKTCGLNPA